MSDLNITEIQQTHLTALSEGAKVVIGASKLVFWWTFIYVS